MLQEKTINIKDFEEKLYAQICLLGRTLYAEALKNWDKELHETRNRATYRDKGTRKTVLKTLMGEVEYNRHVYSFKDNEGKSGTIYLLDEAIGKTGSGFFSEAIVERISTAVCEMPYRKAAATISEMTGQTISHTAAWIVTQKLGESVEEIEQENATKARQNDGVGKLESKLLFEEQDGIWLHLQGKDRKSKGDRCEMKLAIAYDGAKKISKDRFELTNKVACANFETVEKFYCRKEGVIAANYNVDEVELRILNGDGASWIKKSVTDDTVYQLDTFHRNRAILRAAPDAETGKHMIRLLYSKEIGELLEYIQILADSVIDDKQEKNLRNLHTYLSNNQEGLIPYHRKGLNLPEPPEGIEYRRLGAMESNIFTIIGNRMKGRRKSWSIYGGNNLARLLCLKATGKLRTTISTFTNDMPEKYAEEVISELSAAKIQKSVGKGYNGFDSGTVMTTQRWLKDFLKMKSFTGSRI